MNSVRTDLALEARDSILKDAQKVNGIQIYEKKDCKNNINVITMNVYNSTGAAAIKRPIGRYITMEVPNLGASETGYNREISRALAKIIRKLIFSHRKFKNTTPKILVAGLGNRDATPDALGPFVVSNLMITRHIVEFMGYDEIEGAHAVTSAIIPGVMAQTGMDTCEIISAIIKKTQPDMLLVVDALAAGSIKRLNCTIQITDTGILPGAGVGNDRHAINEKTMGIPVIAIGVPTVVDADTIVGKTCQKSMNGYEKMYVTSKDIDAIVKKVSYTISEAINMCMGLHMDMSNNKAYR